MLVMIAGHAAAECIHFPCRTMPSPHSKTAMFANRITRFFMDDHVEEPLQQSPIPEPTGFAPLPAFAGGGGNLSGPPDIYRLAYEQAQQQVARRHERERHLHEWN